MTTIAIVITIFYCAFFSADFVLEYGIHTIIPIEVWRQNLEAGSVALGTAVVVAGKEVVGVFNLARTSLLIIREVRL